MGGRAARRQPAGNFLRKTPAGWRAARQEREIADDVCSQRHRSWSIPLAIFAGSIKVGTPYLFVSVGECITERAGRVNLGLEGTLFMGAMAGFGVSYKTGSFQRHSPLVRRAGGWHFGAMTGRDARRHLQSAAGQFGRRRHRHDDLRHGPGQVPGKAADSAQAPRCPPFGFGDWSSIEQVRAALRINAIFIVGVVLWRRCWRGC